MNNFNLIDETLDLNLTYTYHLSVEVATDSFTYCVLDTIRNKYIAFSRIMFDEELNHQLYSEKMDGFFANEELLTKPFKSSSLIYNTQKFTLVPASLFDKENDNDYFSFNNYRNDNHELFHNKLKTAGAFNIFSIPEVITAVARKRLPKAKFFQQGSPFIEVNLLSHKNKAKQFKVFVNINTSFFDILVINSNDLILYNVFNYKNEDDFAFFILNIFEQLKINPAETELVLSGKIKKDDFYFQKVRKFIKNVRFDRLNENFTYSYTFLDIPSYFFTNLVNLPLCE